MDRDGGGGRLGHWFLTTRRSRRDAVSTPTAIAPQTTAAPSLPQRGAGRHTKVEANPSINISDAAAPPESQAFLLVGAVVLIPMILAYTGYAYWVFRSKVRVGAHYH